MDPRMDPRRRQRRVRENNDDLFARLLGRRQMFMQRPLGGNHQAGPINVGLPFQARNAVPAAVQPPVLRFGQQGDDAFDGKDSPADGSEVRFLRNQIIVMLLHDGDEYSFGHAGTNMKPGVCTAMVDLTEEENYFEVEITSKGVFNEELRVGLATQSHPTTMHLGSTKTSVGFSVFDGKGYFGKPDKTVYSPAKASDRIGIALHFDRGSGGQEGDAEGQTCPVSVVINGKKVLQQEITLPKEPLYPAFSLGGTGQSVKFMGVSRWSSQEEDMLIDDVGEEQMWRRVNHATVNGQLVTYTGKGEAYSEFGVAQGRKPLGPANHYFEVEIVDPGRNCYIALGVTRKDYPTNMHPGWDRGSIAYHADDGKIFTGQGIGNPFGPKCHKGDIMGCGIMFPRDFQPDSDEESDVEDDIVDEWKPGRPNPNRLGYQREVDADNFDIRYYDLHDGDELWSDEEQEALNDWQRKPDRPKVQVFFTRNGTTIGRRENVTIPPGGFFPTVGLLSPEEKVRVDLQPLSG